MFLNKIVDLVAYKAIENRQDGKPTCNAFLPLTPFLVAEN